MRWPAALIFAVVALFVVPAGANAIRFPLVGDPAFLVTFPADWTLKDSDGHPLIVAPLRTAVVAVSFVNSPRPLDDVANDINSLGGPVDNTGEATISGYRGFQYDGQVASPDGVSMKVHMILVTVDEHRVAAITLLTRSGIGAADLAAATGILKGATLTWMTH